MGRGAETDEFQRRVVPEVGNGCGVEDMCDQRGQVGGVEGLDVVGRHEEGGVHGIVVGGGEGGDGIGTAWEGRESGGGGGEGEGADVGGAEGAEDLGFEVREGGGGVGIRVRDERYDVGEGGEATEVLDVYGFNAWMC